MAFTTRADGAVDWRGAGVSGAIFQSLMRNPLGSPDVWALTPGRGAACWWRWCCLVRPDGYCPGSNGGGHYHFAVGRLLAWRNGIDTFRLIIIGIGFAPCWWPLIPGCC